MTTSLRKAQGLTTDRPDLSTLSIIYLCRAFMDQATRQGTRNPIPWDARTERIQEEEMRNAKTKL